MVVGDGLNYLLTGLGPWWWHACNVILHAVCSVLVARTCLTVARLQPPFAGLAAFLFAVHPIHTEAVAGVVGRADILACIFFLSSLLVYHRPLGKKKYVWLSVILGALSMLSKETGVMVFVLNIAFDFYRCWPLVKRSIFRLRIQKKCSNLSSRTTKVVVAVILLVIMRLELLQGTWPTFSQQDNPGAFHPSFLVRSMTFSYLAAFNWWLLLCPWTLSHDWQMGSVPLVTSAWDPRNLLTCAAVVALLLLCYRSVADLGVQKHTPAVLGLLLMILPYLPASNLLVTVGFVIAERILYIPSVGSVIITAYGVQRMWRSKPGTKVFLIIGLGLMASCSVARTISRNADWKDRPTLLRADLETLPQNAKLHYNLGNFLRQTGQPDNAIKHYKEALRLWPSYASAHNNLGTLISEADTAKEHYLLAIKFDKNHANAHFNLGMHYKKVGETQQAISMLEKRILLKPTYTQAYIELVTLEPENEKPKTLRKLLDVDPTNWLNYVIYGNWLRSKGLRAPAARYYLKATRLSFKYFKFDGIVQGDLISIRFTALMLRSLGQNSRILQLLARWHTFRRGWPSAAVAHIYLKELRLKMEMNDRAQIYSKAANPLKSTKCIDHSILEAESKEYQIPNQEVDAEGKTMDNYNSCENKKDSISTQTKITHNKSDSGLKDKRSLKRKNNKKINDIPFAEQVIIKSN